MVCAGAGPSLGTAVEGGAPGPAWEQPTTTDPGLGAGPGEVAVASATPRTLGLTGKGLEWVDDARAAAPAQVEQPIVAAPTT